MYFTNPQKKKSIQVKSGERGAVFFAVQYGREVLEGGRADAAGVA
jgi:hypothetical protein